MVRDVDSGLEVFADLLARLDDPFADRPGVLRAAGLDEQGLALLKARWSAALREASAGESNPVQRFGDTYKRARLALALRNKDDEAPTPDPRFLSAAAQPWREDAAAVPLQASADTTAALPLPVSTRAEASSPGEPRAEDAFIPAAMRHFDDLQRTQEAPFGPEAPALPFDPASNPEMVATAPLPIELILAARSVVRGSPGLTLPFKPPEATPELPDWLPPGIRSFTDVEKTQSSFDAPPAKPALPFNSTVEAKLPPAYEQARPARPQLPSPQPSSLSLEQFASLCVELELHPGERADTLQRYRLTEEQFRQLDAHWRAQMIADPGRRAAWEHACLVYKGWLLRSGRRRE